MFNETTCGSLNIGGALRDWSTGSTGCLSAGLVRVHCSVLPCTADVACERVYARMQLIMSIWTFLPDLIFVSYFFVICMFVCVCVGERFVLCLLLR